MGCELGPLAWQSSAPSSPSLAFIALARGDTGASRRGASSAKCHGCSAFDQRRSQVGIRRAPDLVAGCNYQPMRRCGAACGYSAASDEFPCDFNDGPRMAYPPIATAMVCRQRYKHQLWQRRFLRCAPVRPVISRLPSLAVLRALLPKNWLTL
jgi:hypothetical protein